MTQGKQAILCRCGCGQEITNPSKNTLYRLKKGLPVGYIHGHQHRGERNVNWVGGKHMSRGYIYVLEPDHPKATKSGHVLEHRLVMEKHLGRYLEDHEVPHHVNGNRSDNRIENLVVLTQAEHKAHHARTENPNRKNPARGERNNQSKVTANDVLAIRKAAATGTPMDQLASQYGITYGGVWRIVRRYNWKHI